MTLARRLALSLGAILVLLVLSGIAVVVIQRDYAIEQLDARVAAASVNPRLVAIAAPGAGEQLRPRAEPAAAVLSELYVGVVGPDGTLRTIQAPAEDPELVPDLGPGVRAGAATGRPTLRGEAKRVRVITTAVRGRPGGVGTVTAVVAVPTTSADDATRRLVLTLAGAGLALAAGLALIVWWVHRLGLVPIARMTTTAEEIAAGARDRRWSAEHPGTEAHRLGEALNAMLASEQAAQDRMRRFVADASHELRTPLTTLRGYSTLYGGQVAARPDDVEEALGRISDEARRMGGIVEALLDLSDLDEHGVTGLGPIDVVPLLTAVVADLHVIASGRAITLQAPQALWAMADADRITQAVLSLTSNALRHTPAGSPITIRAYPTPGAIRIEVADAGPGIAAEHLPHIFDRFYRTDRGRDRASGGNGLGLAIVAAIATAHRGSFGVESDPGRGSQFWIEVPAAGPAPPPA